MEEHPEQRRLVFRHRKQPNDGDKLEEEPILQKRNVFNKHGLPRHPERSIYYDPIMNPFGVAPPGMPYMERRELDPPPITLYSRRIFVIQPLDQMRLIMPRKMRKVCLYPHPVSIADELFEDDDDDDIVMPDGPPPGAEGEEEDSDDDIPMPEGPPPGQEPQRTFFASLFTIWFLMLKTSRSINIHTSSSTPISIISSQPSPTSYELQRNPSTSTAWISSNFSAIPTAATTTAWVSWQPSSASSRILTTTPTTTWISTSATPPSSRFPLSFSTIPSSRIFSSSQSISCRHARPSVFSPSPNLSSPSCQPVYVPRTSIASSKPDSCTVGLGLEFYINPSQSEFPSKSQYCSRDSLRCTAITRLQERGYGICTYFNQTQENRCIWLSLVIENKCCTVSWLRFWSWS